VLTAATESGSLNTQSWWRTPSSSYASYLPLLALVLARLAGASPLTAANVGLVVAIVVMTLHGWWAGRAAQLRGRQLLFVTMAAAGLGLVMILLKDLVLLHLH